MLHKIEDPLGQVWHVGKGDPCHKAVQMLHARHYSWIVLPRLFIRGQFLLPTKQLRELDWKAALRKAHQLGYNTVAGKRSLRLAECLKVLGG